MKKYLQKDETGLVVGYFEAGWGDYSNDLFIEIPLDFDAMSLVGHAEKNGVFIKKPSNTHIWTGEVWEDTITVETEWAKVRAKRLSLLTACDWTQLPDVPLATKEAWATYRQALRDVTNQPDPFNIIWPTPPN